MEGGRRERERGRDPMEALFAYPVCLWMETACPLPHKKTAATLWLQGRAIRVHAPMAIAPVHTDRPSFPQRMSSESRESLRLFCKSLQTTRVRFLAPFLFAEGKIKNLARRLGQIYRFEKMLSFDCGGNYRKTVGTTGEGDAHQTRRAREVGPKTDVVSVVVMGAVPNAADDAQRGSDRAVPEAAAVTTSSSRQTQRLHRASM